jgi:hypothetical protein
VHAHTAHPCPHSRPQVQTRGAPRGVAGPAVVNCCCESTSTEVQILQLHPLLLWRLTMGSSSDALNLQLRILQRQGQAGIRNMTFPKPIGTHPSADQHALDCVMWLARAPHLDCPFPLSLFHASQTVQLWLDACLPELSLGICVEVVLKARGGSGRCCRVSRINLQRRRSNQKYCIKQHNQPQSATSKLRRPACCIGKSAWLLQDRPKAMCHCVLCIHSIKRRILLLLRHKKANQRQASVTQLTW